MVEDYFRKLWWADDEYLRPPTPTSATAPTLFLSVNAMTLSLQIGVPSNPDSFFKEKKIL